ncbi:MAG: hypothetical protein ACTHK2_11295 [Dokdonella sp.]|uniref:hypothetical protein n=1 Tax=Dokdonella sp. TaxID=2291710 RepID=UPI003F8030C5
MRLSAASFSVGATQRIDRLAMRVEYVSDHYGAKGGIVFTVYMGPHKLGHYLRDGDGCSARWYHLECPRRSWIERFESIEAGRAAFEAFAPGLEIVPWDEHGQPEPTG